MKLRTDEREYLKTIFHSRLFGWLSVKRAVLLHSAGIGYWDTAGDCSNGHINLRQPSSLRILQYWTILFNPIFTELRIHPLFASAQAKWSLPKINSKPLIIFDGVTAIDVTCPCWVIYQDSDVRKAKGFMTTDFQRGFYLRKYPFQLYNS